MANTTYHNFPQFVLRTPLLSLDFYRKFTGNETITDEQYKDILTNPVIAEALFLASPAFYDELKKWEAGKINDPKKVERLKNSFLKYISRMATRPTPFGLFAGLTTGDFAEETNITLKAIDQHKRHSRLDMNYLVSLSQDILKSENITDQLLFYPNSTIYSVGDQIRYVEYKYINGKREHHLIAVTKSDYLEKILTLSKQGIHASGLAQVIVDEEVTYEDAKDFIDELIYNQILVSKLEPSVTGDSYLDSLCSTLKEIDSESPTYKTLKKVGNDLSGLDKSIGNDPQKYLEIAQSLEQIGTEINLKYMFQTDMFITHDTNYLSTGIADSVKEGLTFLNKITSQYYNPILKKFADSFRERYETSEVSLSLALDSETGLLYKEINNADINTLIDDLVFTNEGQSENMKFEWSPFDLIFQKKLMEATSKNQPIRLTDDDVKSFKENWDDLPDTMATLIEVINIDGQQKITFTGTGNSSAANLIGRFCHGDDVLREHAQQIIDTESQINSDKILAEIIHLPESRTGNILSRPSFREYEIPYLGKSTLNAENQIPLDDLYLSVKNDGNILLRSKKHNKEVIPRLTNAHNYSNNSLPIYHFLCDLQTQGKRNLPFFLNQIFNGLDHMPRIEYKNLILQEATWNIKKSVFEKLYNITDNTEILKKTAEITEAHKIPQYVKLIQGDNELVINFRNTDSIKMLLKAAETLQQFQLKEFLFNEKQVVKNQQHNETYSNQIVISYYNKKLKHD